MLNLVAIYQEDCAYIGDSFSFNIYLKDPRPSNYLGVFSIPTGATFKVWLPTAAKTTLLISDCGASSLQYGIIAVNVTAAQSAQLAPSEGAKVILLMETAGKVQTFETTLPVKVKARSLAPPT